MHNTIQDSMIKYTIFFLLKMKLIRKTINIQKYWRDSVVLFTCLPFLVKLFKSVCCTVELMRSNEMNNLKIVSFI